jgi:general stress protein 26
MRFPEILSRALSILAESRFALFTTIDEKGYPRSRWMTPVAIPRLPGALYAVTARGWAKARQVAADPRVEWCVQSPGLDRIARLQGDARIVDEPALAAEVLKAIGPNLQAFWKNNPSTKELVVVETELRRASIFRPLAGELEEAEAGNE